MKTRARKRSSKSVHQSLERAEKAAGDGNQQVVVTLQANHHGCSVFIPSVLRPSIQEKDPTLERDMQQVALRLWKATHSKSRTTSESQPPARRARRSAIAQVPAARSRPPTNGEFALFEANRMFCFATSRVNDVAPANSLLFFFHKL